MAKKPSGFVVFPEHVAVTRLLSNEERGLLLLALSDYAENQVLPEGHSAAFMTCFELMKNAIDRQQERYKSTCERNRQNIMKRWSEADSSTLYGGIPSNTGEYERIPDVPMDTICTNQTEHNQTEQEERAPRKRFTPLSLEEVRDYGRDHGLTADDASQFVDFYASKGWKVGSQPMKDWRAAVRNWARRKAQTTPRKEADDYYANFPRL